MPLPPNLPVPHIVGDDEIEDELDGNAPISDHRLETDSCLSDTSCDDDEDIGDGSSSSDGADWSMNVTRIAATPGRVPIFAGASPRVKPAVVAEERLKSPILAGQDNAQSMPEMPEMDVEMEEPSLLSLLNLQPTSQVTTNAVDMDAGDLEAQVSTSTSPPKDDSSQEPGSLRNPENASAASQTQSMRSLRSAPGAMPRRPAGRSGRIVKMRTRGDLDNTLAKPLDITAYFRVVSANLVRNRITLKTFQFLRDSIDRLLLETFEDPSLIPRATRSTQ